MKTFLLFTSILLITASSLFGQDSAPVVNMAADRYFKAYATEPEYKVSSINEDMIKKIRKNGVWGNPKWDSFMSRVTLTKHVSFKATQARTLQIVNQINASIKKDKIYKPYLTMEKDGYTYYFYTQTAKDNTTTELFYFTILKDKDKIVVGDFAGNNIDANFFKPEK